jgi:hypothetical protein
LDLAKVAIKKPSPRPSLLDLEACLVAGTGLIVNVRVIMWVFEEAVGLVRRINADDSPTAVSD